MQPKPDRSAAIFFCLLTLIYLTLSPLSVKRMGYTSEQVEAARGLLVTFSQATRGDFTTSPLTWPRHGLLEPLLEVPFVLVGQLTFCASSRGEDVILSLQPILASALLCTILFVWVRRITANRAWAMTLGLAAGLTTMLWPFAYIGLETTQSLFLLLAACLALGDETPARWTRSLVFALAAGMAVGVKANGFVLLPAVAFLAGVQWRRTRAAAGLGVIAVIVAIFMLNEYWRDLSPVRTGGSRAIFQLYSVDGPLTAVLNTLYLLAAPNKGLLIYCPILVIALVSLRRAYQEDTRVVIFSVLTLAGLVAGSAVIVSWADETWGPRYLHSAVAPLIVCLALAKRGAPMRVRTEAPLLAAMVLGFAVSTLGVLFCYGSAALAATAAGQKTLQDIQHDPAWNPMRLHAVLLRVWMRGPEPGPVAWPPNRHRWFPGARGIVCFSTLQDDRPAGVRGTAAVRAGTLQMRRRGLAALALIRGVIVLPLCRLPLNSIFRWTMRSVRSRSSAATLRTAV